MLGIDRKNAGSGTVGPRDPGNSGRRCVPLEQLPDDLFAERQALNLAAAVHGPEHLPSRDAGRRRPRVDRHLNPRRHRYRPDAAMLADEVHDTPSPVSLLDVPKSERCHFGSPQPAPEEDGENRAVAQALRGHSVRRIEQFLCLLDGQTNSPGGCLSTRHPSRG
jgi:hypothetical protein